MKSLAHAMLWCGLSSCPLALALGRVHPEMFAAFVIAITLPAFMVVFYAWVMVPVVAREDGLDVEGELVRWSDVETPTTYSVDRRWIWIWIPGGSLPGKRRPVLVVGAYEDFRAMERLRAVGAPPAQAYR